MGTAAEGDRQQSEPTEARATSTRLERQLAFLIEADRLKGILRQTTLCDGSRRENSAEHSWHLALMATVLAEHTEPGIDVVRVLRMLLVHDLVEIDAGDAFAYDAAANVGREDRERRAADRIFGLLPAQQGRELHALWNEFEAQVTPESRVAVALDRLQPLLNNHHSGGGSWLVHGVTREQVLRRMEPIRTALPAVWPAVEALIARSCALGHIRDGDG